MPISVVVGGQYGSEGKGKAALEIARRARSQVVAVRVGGPNSGHTGYDSAGRKRVFRQIPVAAADGNADLVIPAGSYVEPELLLAELEELGVDRARVTVDRAARIVTEAHRRWESEAQLTPLIGSTGSGTGAAVIAAAARGSSRLGLGSPRAADEPRLKGLLGDAAGILREQLDLGARVIVEGTQGFGLSVIHGEWPHATSRDTTAAGFLSEAGLSPRDVDDVTLVLRCHPIRVAGASGDLAGETDWETIAREARADRDLTELTTVTKKVRRVGRFDAGLARRAIMINQPTRIVLNHLDYVDWTVREGLLSEKAQRFVAWVEREIGRRTDWLGTDERHFVASPPAAWLAPLMSA
jgi:adenylosuccinate synthase